MSYAPRLSDDMSDLRPLGEGAELMPDPPEGQAPQGPPLAHTGVIAPGGLGKMAAPWLYALAQRDGLSLPILVPDNDWRLPDAVLLAGRDPVRLPKQALLQVGAAHPRNAIKEWPLLTARYLDGGLFRGIPVFDSYPSAGFGASGYPAISAADLDLSIAQLYSALVAFLRRVCRPAALQTEGDFWQAAAQGHDLAVPPPARSRLLFIGGGCGSMAHAGHLLLPGLARHIVTQVLGQPAPYLVGVVAGPDIYAGLHERTQTNWLALVQQLDDQTREGLHWEFINGVTVDDDTPPYDRIVLADGEPRPDGKAAEEAELAAFAARVARSVYVALASDLFERTEALTANDRRSPWTTLRGVLAQADWEAVQSLAAASRAAGRAEALAASAA